MKITAVKAIPISIPFYKPFMVWRGVANNKDHVIVLVETDEDIIGVGEASPFLYYGNETQQDVVSTIEKYIEPLVIGLDPFNLEQVDSIFHTVIDGHHFSKSAIEMALWDVMGKKLDIPVYKLLGGKYRSAIPVVAILKSSEPNNTAHEAEEWVAKGFRQLKVKIGFDPEKDVSTVFAVRKAVGNDITIRVDAEENYDLKTAIQVVRKLEKAELELISQPIPRHNYSDMAILRKAIDIPLLLDECIESPEDVLLAARMEIGDLINIKIVKSGGILNARRMVAIAAAAGKGCLLGSMIENGPGTLFAGHFAIATAKITHACELVGPLLISDDVLADPIVYQDGSLQIPDKPGLGIELDLEKLKRYATI